MRCRRILGGFVALLVLRGAASAAVPTLADELAELKRQVEAAGETAYKEVTRTSPPGQRRAAYDLYRKKEVSPILGRIVAFAETHPDALEAIDALIYAVDIGKDVACDSETNAALDLMGRRYLDRVELLAFIQHAWVNPTGNARLEEFLQTASERSGNRNVRALATLSLGRRKIELAQLIRDLNDPVIGPIIATNLDARDPKRLRRLDAAKIEHEGEAILERTIREHGDERPLGKDFPPLGEQVEGLLFKLHNVAVGREVPEIEGQDVDGKPMKLSDYRGNVVVLTFWASWCGPCMGLVPDEKALVDRMKGRPFVMLGVNGDEDRAKAKSVTAKEGITWRSFWNGGPQGAISVKWGIYGWPTVYVIDAKGVIRDDGTAYFRDLRGPGLDASIEPLVAAAEVARAKGQ